MSWMRGLAGITLLAGTWLCSASCSKSAEDFCQSWADARCEVMAGCCQTGETFDANRCRFKEADGCMKDGWPEMVRAGIVKFDRGAAEECVGTVETCADVTATAVKTFDQAAACGNMLTGFRAPGEPCDDSYQCAPAGDYPTCYKSAFCAGVVRDQSTCSFSFESGELHACDDGLYCDMSGITADPSKLPSTQTYEFSAPCKAIPKAGQSCIGGTAASPTPIPCADGLFCNYAYADSGITGTCMAPLGEGAPCTVSGTDPCAAGLSCDYEAGAPTCKKTTTTGKYCYKPPVCGDGVCDAYEDETSCPQDCAAAVCGDGTCSADEDAYSCAEDCSVCGDGICDDYEDADLCPDDCGA